MPNADMNSGNLLKFTSEITYQYINIALDDTIYSAVDLLNL